MLIPERTVDSLLAYELLAARPLGIIWSPTNTRGSYDHAFVSSPGQAVVFECKGIQDRGRIRVNFDQLDDYVNRGLTSLLYALPAQPVDPGAPWKTSCSCASECTACAPSTHPTHRRRANTAPVIASAPWERRIQPWFSHWTWCISASDLKSAYASKSSDFGITIDDATFGAIPGAARLCHLLAPLPPSSASSSRGSDGVRPSPPPGGPPAPGADGGGPVRSTRPRTPHAPVSDGGQTANYGLLERYAVTFAQLKQFVDSTSHGKDTPSRRPGSVGLLLS